MRGPEHVAIAVATTGGALFLMSHGQLEMSASTVTILAIAAVGSLVPDLDHPKSWISNRIPATLLAYGLVFLLGFAIASWYSSSLDQAAVGGALWTSLIDFARPLLGWAWFSLVLGAGLLVLAGVLAKALEHRGPTHSLAAGVALALVASIAFAIAPRQPWTLGLWFGWGYLSHLLADFTTPMGCPALLWPLRGVEEPARSASVPSAMTSSTPGGERTSTQVAASHPMSVSGSAGQEEGAGHSAGCAPQTAEAGRLNPHTAGETDVAATANQAETSPNQRWCPKCGGALVLREARRGTRAGKKFYGCASFPRCRHVENIAG